MSKNDKTATASQAQSPYLNARQEWFEMFGSVAKNAAHWRMFALLLVLLLLLSVSGNIYQGMQNKIVPYIVAVDKVAGKAAAISRADVASETPRRLIQANIAEVIHNWRTVTPDLELQQGLINKLSAYLAGSARGTAKSWLEENNPFTRAEKSIVSVEIKGLPLPVSADSWRVEWTETVRNHAGITQSVTAYEAMVSIAITPPVTDAQIVANPGGVFVTGISFSKLLGQ